MADADAGAESGERCGRNTNGTDAEDNGLLHLNDLRLDGSCAFAYETLASDSKAYSNGPVLAEAPSRDSLFRCRLRNLAGNSGHVSGLQQFVALVLLGFGLLLSLLVFQGLLTLRAGCRVARVAGAREVVVAVQVKQDTTAASAEAARVQKAGSPRARDAALRRRESVADDGVIRAAGLLDGLMSLAIRLVTAVAQVRLEHDPTATAATPAPKRRAQRSQLECHRGTQIYWCNH